MTLVENEHGELYNPEDFDPPKHMELRRGPRNRPRKHARKQPTGGRVCAYCGEPLPKNAHPLRKYCDDRCKKQADKLAKMNRGRG